VGAAAGRSRTAATLGVIAVGGAAGALARYGIETQWSWEPPGFPWATLVINLLGCALIGIVLVLLLEVARAPWWVRPLVAVGLIGGFTTFSTFAVEAIELVDGSAAGTALLYVAVSVFAGLLCVWLAAHITRQSYRRVRHSR
jgi:CrcB protein